MHTEILAHTQCRAALGQPVSSAMLFWDVIGSQWLAGQGRLDWHSVIMSFAFLTASLLIQSFLG